MKVGVVFLLITLGLVSIKVAEAKNIICYFASWTVYHSGNGQFDVSNIDPSLCTHIMFAFVGLSYDYKVAILDSWESNDDYGYKAFEHLVNLKQSNPNLKVLVSMGGWNEGSGKYSQLAADPIKRKVLSKDVLRFIKEYNFDGFDLDWEYPGLRDNADPEHDKANYVELLKDLKAVLEPNGLLLSAAVSGGVSTIDIAYDVPAISDVLDIINVMAYDFHGAFENFVGHCSPLYKSSLDSTEDLQKLNVASGIEHFLELGADPAKLHLGVVTYGRSFTLADPTNTSLYAPVIGGGNAGPYSGQDGILNYNEICELHSDWTYVWDDEQKVPHRFSGNQWVGYEDVNSIRLKAEFANSKNLGGMMVWSFDCDDFRGLCGSESYPLLRTVYKTLNQ